MVETFIGDTVVHDGTGTTPYYSPLFGRGGEAAVFSVEATHIKGTPGLVVAIEHKNAEDTTFTNAGTFSTINSVGVATREISGLKEELRFAFTFNAGSQGDFAHVLIPAPMWLPY